MVKFKYSRICFLTLVAFSACSLAITPEICTLDPAKFYFTIAQEKDRQALIDLAVASNERFNACLMSKSFSEQILSPEPDEIRDGLVIILMQKNCSTVLGFYAMNTKAEFLAKHMIELKLLFIHEKYTRQGLGTLLLTRATEHASKLGMQTMRLFSMPESEGFYVKHGAIKKGILFNLYNSQEPLVMFDMDL